MARARLQCLLPLPIKTLLLETNPHRKSSQNKWKKNVRPIRMTNTSGVVVRRRIHTLIQYLTIISNVPIRQGRQSEQ